MFAAPDHYLIQGSGKSRGRGIIRTGIERRGFEFPLGEICDGGVRQFKCGHRVAEFPAVEAMDGLHGQVRAVFASAGNGDAVTALGTFELIRPPHALF